MTPRRAEGLVLAATLIGGVSFVVIKQTLAAASVVTRAMDW